MSNRTLSLLILLALAAPQAADAGVIISEIAWMGTSVSDTDEWIELHNDGTEDVSLAGWKLEASGTAPKISLAGTIAAGGYYLLERTDDTTVPGVTADKIYTGALSNAGDTLTLKDAAGATVDTVAGGTDWKDVGGSNSTKHTAQRTGTSWSTAEGTPRALNAVGSSDDDEDEETEDESTGTSTPVVTVGGTAPSTSSAAQSPKRTISLDAGSDRIVLSGVPTPYSALAYGKNERVVDGADIVWNFGDGSRLEGEEVEYAYREPGEYVLSVRARHKEAEALRTLKVVVEAPSVTVQADPKGARLLNAGSRLVDLSGWKLEAGGASFMLPPDTALWPGGSVVFVSSVTGLATGTPVSLLYPEGEPVAYADPASEPATTTVASAPSQKPVAPPAGYQKVKKVELPAPVPVQAYEEVVVAPAAVTQQAAVGAARVPVKRPTWLMCLLGGALACSAALAVP